MNDEKTTEIEIPPPLASNIVRVNFTERRKISKIAAPAPRMQEPVRRSQSQFQSPPPIDLQNEWTTPWWVRLLALTAILVLSLFVL